MLRIDEKLPEVITGDTEQLKNNLIIMHGCIHELCEALAELLSNIYSHGCNPKPVHDQNTRAITLRPDTTWTPSTAFRRLAAKSLALLHRIAVDPKAWPEPYNRPKFRYLKTALQALSQAQAGAVVKIEMENELTAEIDRKLLAVLCEKANGLNYHEEDDIDS